jgi:hypothetical protein
MKGSGVRVSPSALKSLAGRNCTPTWAWHSCDAAAQTPTDMDAANPMRRARLANNRPWSGSNDGPRAGVACSAKNPAPAGAKRDARCATPSRCFAFYVFGRVPTGQR